MDCSLYIDELAQKYSNYFDVYHDHTTLDDRFDLYAEYRMRGEKYFFLKSASIFAFENFEYCFVKSFKDDISLSDLENFTNTLVRAVDEKVKPNEEHMSSYITGVIVSQKPIPIDIVNMGKKFKHSKDFLFSLKGWCDVRLIMADLGRNEVYTNKNGRQIKNIYTIDR